MAGDPNAMDQLQALLRRREPLYAMADHTMGAAAQSMTDQLILTAEFKLSLLRGARGQHLECVGSVLKPGRLVMFTEAEVFVLDGSARTLVAKASATMAVTGR